MAIFSKSPETLNGVKHIILNLNDRESTPERNNDYILAIDTARNLLIKFNINKNTIFQSFSDSVKNSMIKEEIKRYIDTIDVRVISEETALKVVSGMAKQLISYLIDDVNKDVVQIEKETLTKLKELEGILEDKTGFEFREYGKLFD